MKREDLTKLGLTDDAVIDAIMAAHGKDIEKFKTNGDAVKAELDGLKSQLNDANTQIEGFKNMKPEELQKAADEWKLKFEQAQKDHTAQLQTLEFDREFGTALSSANVKYLNEVKSKLNLDELKDNQGKFIYERFTEQIGKIKADAADLFTDAKEPPIITTGVQPTSTKNDSVWSAMLKGAGLTETAK